MPLRPFALFVAGATVLAGLSVAPPAQAAPLALHRILFDNTSAETAGNADWIVGTSQPDPTAQNANPQRETDWTGALSAWGVSLRRTGQYSLKTLPASGTISFGNTANALDLSNFDEFVLPEPNILLTAAEKTAIMRFVQNGGGLFLISDHTGSDRDNDGSDSPKIINDLLTNNGVDNTDPFGFSVDLKNISSDHPVAITDASNPVLNGSFGAVRHSLIANGTTFTLRPADNPSVRGLVYLSTATPGNTNAFFVTSTFGAGRVAIWGDSSTIDDGTGQSGNTLFNGWTDPTADNAALGLNATAWLAGSGGSAGVSVNNPGSQNSAVGSPVSLRLAATGGTAPYTWTATNLPAGLSVSTAGLISGTPATAGTSTVTATARDTTGATGSASFSWTVGTGGGCTSPGQKLTNPGFESGAGGWTATASVVGQHGSSEPARTGTWNAWLDGYGTMHTDTLRQQVTLPSGCAAYTLTFWLHIDSAETGGTVFDTLTAQVLDPSGAILSTLATFSNADAASGYQSRSFSLSGFAGRTVTLSFAGTEGSKLQTSFVLDDTALTVS